MSGDNGFFHGLQEGFVDAAGETWQLAKELARAGHALATDSAAREEAWNSAKHAAGVVQHYGAQVLEDPAKVWRDTRDVASAAWTAVDEFRKTAGPQDWGHLAGAGAVEIASAAIPASIISKAVKSKKIVDKAADAAKLSKKFPDAPITPKQSCSAAIKKTKEGMRLRDDLGPEHFDSQGNLKWPEPRGFAGPPVPMTLERGTIIDRYSPLPGNLDRGSFFSPAGTPYAERALPYDPSKMQYTRYEVIKPFEVNGGKAAPAFNEKGGGIQYDAPLATNELIKQGYLKPL